MKFMRKRENRCSATTGSTYRIHGKQDFRCDLPDDGHEIHQHFSEVLFVRWHIDNGHMMFTDNSGNTSSVTLTSDGTLPAGVTIWSKE